MTCAWAGLAKIHASVAQKQLQLQKEKQVLMINTMVSCQVKLLDRWNDTERQYVAALSTTRDSLQSVVCRLPIVDRAKGIFGSGATFYLQAWTIERRGALFSALFNPLATIIATTITFLFLHENIYVGSLVGAFVVIVGLYIVLWGKAEDYGTKTKLDQKDDSIEQVDAGQSDLHEPLLPGTREVDVKVNYLW
ncbi:WAT1-related protein [Dioscorea alata]|uniref:WAT1-related protein n=2 Tax=Dioscorea alata TaxID=55571 RepID=A0ACB7WSV3_DIOAL|nr:WAT1-related protein [Dioscorea alata]KAH7691874.1 WAT1-related protein [Dioscorea alata]